MPKYNFGFKEEELDNIKWFESKMETHGSAIIYNRKYPDGVMLGIFKNNTSTTHGCEHAEDVFIRNVKENKAGLLTESPNVNTLILSISKSPCSSSYKTTNKAQRGCAEELIKFQNNPFITANGIECVCKLIVIARGVYKQSDGSHQALKMMQENGITVVTDAHRKKDGTPMLKEFC